MVGFLQGSLSLVITGTLITSAGCSLRTISLSAWPCDDQNPCLADHRCVDQICVPYDDLGTPGGGDPSDVLDGDADEPGGDTDGDSNGGSAGDSSGDTGGDSSGDSVGDSTGDTTSGDSPSLPGDPTLTVSGVSSATLCDSVTLTLELANATGSTTDVACTAPRQELRRDDSETDFGNWQDRSRDKRKPWGDKGIDCSQGGKMVRLDGEPGAHIAFGSGNLLDTTGYDNVQITFQAGFQSPSSPDRLEVQSCCYDPACNLVLVDQITMPPPGELVFGIHLPFVRWS